MTRQVFIPTFITVHLGKPDEEARNVTVYFKDYVKNVGSSEVYPTWPENSIRANMYAQISFALNRIYTEWYPSKGYDFDITASPDIDQNFIEGREIFEPMNRIGDEIFDEYIRRIGNTEPLSAQYCNGTTSTCAGLSQWGTVPLAEEGLTPLEILKTYYGDDIEIVQGAPITTNIPSYPNELIRLGDSGTNVQTIKNKLNRISDNYPLLPKIKNLDDEFDEELLSVIRLYQEVFNLQVDGIIGKETWYSIVYVYNAVKSLGELASEGVELSPLTEEFKRILQRGDVGGDVKVAQFFLATISDFNAEIPKIEITGTFDRQTENAVKSFQEFYGIPATGIIDSVTFQELFDNYEAILATDPIKNGEVVTKPAPGIVLVEGMSGDAVRTFQGYLSYIATIYDDLPMIEATGVFGPMTTQAVIAFQERYDLLPTGRVDNQTWDKIAEVYGDLKAANL